jgi:hypothetical protein
MSFQAEGYGFLSISHFLLRLQEFCDVKLMTDNLRFLTRVKKCLPYPDPFPNTTLQADWDVANKIVCALQSMNLMPQFKHIHGHQDDHTPYDDIPLKAQLNVNADTEVGFYQTTYPAKRPLIPRLSNNCIQQHLFNKAISSKLKQSIHNAFTVPPYLAYLQARNNQVVFTLYCNN